MQSQVLCHDQLTACLDECYICNDGSSCAQCKSNFAILSGGQCDFCTEGKINIKTGTGCQACTNSSCHKYCWDNATGEFNSLPSEFCLVCPTGQFLDLNTYSCGPNCPASAPIQIDIDLPYGDADAVETYSFCRGHDIYVDVSSLMPMELGTEQYPYKEIEDAFLEVFSIMDSTTEPINIFIKEGTTNYLYKKGNYATLLMNLPQITVTSYCSAGSGEDCQAAEIALMYNGTKKVHATSVFTLIKDSSYDLDAKVTSGTLTAAQKSNLDNLTTGAFIQIINSQVSIININFIHDETDIAAQAGTTHEYIYLFDLHDQGVNLLKVEMDKFMIRGGIIRSNEPQSIHFANSQVTVDYLTLGIISADHMCDSGAPDIQTDITFQENHIIGTLMTSRTTSTFMLSISSTLVFQLNNIEATFPISDDTKKFLDVQLKSDCVFSGLTELPIHFKENTFTYPDQTMDSHLGISIQEMSAFNIDLSIQIEKNNFDSITNGKYSILNYFQEPGSLLHVSLVSDNSKIFSLDNVYENCHLKEGEMTPLVFFDSVKEINEENSMFTNVYGYDIMKLSNAENINVSKVQMAELQTAMGKFQKCNSIAMSSLLVISTEHYITVTECSFTNSNFAGMQAFLVEQNPLDITMTLCLFQDLVINNPDEPSVIKGNSLTKALFDDNHIENVRPIEDRNAGVTGHGFIFIVVEFLNNGVDSVVFSNTDVLTIEMQGCSLKYITDLPEVADIPDDDFVQTNVKFHKIKWIGYYGTYLSFDILSTSFVQQGYMEYFGKAFLWLYECELKDLWSTYSFLTYGSHMAHQPITFDTCILDNIYEMNFEIWSIIQESDDAAASIIKLKNCEISKYHDSLLKSFIQLWDWGQIIVEDSLFYDISSISKKGAILGAQANQFQRRKSYFTNTIFRDIVSLYPTMMPENQIDVIIDNCTFESIFSFNQVLSVRETARVHVNNSIFRYNQSPQAQLIYLQNSKQDNILENTTITENNPLFIQEFITSLNDMTYKIRPFLTEVFMTEARKEISNLEKLETSSQYAIVTVYSTMTITNLTVDKQSNILSMYLQSIIEASQITITNTQLTEIQLALMKITGSTLKVTDLTMEAIGIDASEDQILSVFQVQSESICQIKDSTIKQIDVPLFQVDNSDLELDGVTVETVSTINPNQQPMNVQFSTMTIKDSTISDFQSEAYSIGQFQLSELIVEMSTFTNIRNVLFQINDSQYTITDSVFQDFSHSDKAVRALEVHQTESTTQGTIQGSTFKNIVSQIDGAALYTQNGQTSISTSLFESNQAKNGGAVFTFSDSGLTDSVSIVDTTFRQNSAETYGGAIQYENYIPQIDDLTKDKYDSNSAQFGHDIGGFALQVVIDEEQTAILGSERRLQDTQILNDDQVSGQNIKTPIVFSILDPLGRVITIDNSSQATIIPTDSSAQIGGVNTVTAKDGKYIFDQIVFIADPGSQKVGYQITSSAINTVKAQEVFGVEDTALYFQINTRNCLAGEELKNGMCLVCPPGKYSLFEDSTECLSCPSNALCPGSNEIVVDEGYWRQSEESAEIVACLFGPACIGGNGMNEPAEGGFIECAPGYQGMLCHECILNKDFRYSRSGRDQCLICQDGSTTTLRIVGLMLVILIFVFILIMKSKDSVSSILFRILTNYIQVLSTTASFDLQWPGPMESYFSAVNVVGEGAQSVLSIDCFIYEGSGQTDGQATADLFYLKILIAALLPIGMVAFFLLFWLIPFLKSKSKSFYIRSVTVSSIVILFLVHPTLMQMAFSMYNCYTIIDKNYLMRDLRIECWSGEHVAWGLGLGLPMIIIWIIGAPALGFLVLYKNKHKLEEIEFLGKFRMMYQGIRPKVFYWEFVNTFRKLGLIVISVFLSTYSETIRDILQPFKLEIFNVVQFREAVTSIITIYGGLFFLTPSLSDIARIVVMIIVLAVNFWFFSLWVYTMLQQPSIRKVCTRGTGVCKRCMFVKSGVVDQYLDNAGTGANTSNATAPGIPKEEEKSLDQSGATPVPGFDDSKAIMMKAYGQEHFIEEESSEMPGEKQVKKKQTKKKSTKKKVQQMYEERKVGAKRMEEDDYDNFYNDDEEDWELEKAKKASLAQNPKTTDRPLVGSEKAPLGKKKRNKAKKTQEDFDQLDEEDQGEIVNEPKYNAKRKTKAQKQKQQKQPQGSSKQTPAARSRKESQLSQEDDESDLRYQDDKIFEDDSNK